MPENFTIGFDGGLATARQGPGLQPGELNQATGGWYKPGDMRLHKIAGRPAFGDTGAAVKIKGLAVCKFDAGGSADLLLALSGTTVYSATLGTSGTFSSLLTGLDAGATTISAAHQNDRWYLAFGAGKNKILEADATTRDLGMDAPSDALVAVTAAVGTSAFDRPDSDSSTGWNATAFAYNGNTASAALAPLSTPSTATMTLSWTAGTTTASHRIIVDYDLRGAYYQDDDPLPSGGGINDGGVVAAGGFEVTILIEYSTNGGADYTTALSRAGLTGPVQRSRVSVAVADSLDSGDIKVRVSLTYVDGTRQAVLAVYDVRLEAGSVQAAFTTDDKLVYAYLWYNSADDERSPVGPPTEVTLSSENKVTLTRASGDEPAAATHWEIYRTPDSGTFPNQAGLVAQVPIAETVMVDSFDIDKDTQTTPLVPMLQIAVTGTTASGSTIRIPRDSPPPALKKIRYYDGSLVGFSVTNPRALHYSIPGLPTSWPEVYVINKFPLPDNDQLVDGHELSGAFIVFTREAVMRVEGLPRLVQGSFAGGSVVAIAGAPGLVSDRGMTPYTVGGISRLAWISPYGVFETTGAQHRSISEDIDWTALEPQDKSNWALAWDPARYALIFAYSAASGTENDRYFMVHMHPTQRKQNGQPKWTGPHYGALGTLAGGPVSGRFRLYSGHTSDGKVYLEESGTTDASNAFDASGTVPYIVSREDLYSGWSEWSVLGANLRHSDWGAGQEATVAFTGNVDSSGGAHSRTSTVSLAGEKGTQFDIARRVERATITITANGAATGSLTDMRVEARQLGGAGKVVAL